MGFVERKRRAFSENSGERRWSVSDSPTHVRESSFSFLIRASDSPRLKSISRRGIRCHYYYNRDRRRLEMIRLVYVSVSAVVFVDVDVLAIVFVFVFVLAIVVVFVIVIVFVFVVDHTFDVHRE